MRIILKCHKKHKNDTDNRQKYSNAGNNLIDNSLKSFEYLIIFRHSSDRKSDKDEEKKRSFLFPLPFHV